MRWRSVGGDPTATDPFIGRGRGVEEAWVMRHDEQIDVAF